MAFWAVTFLNGISYGLLLFMLSAGLTLIYGLMGILNFAHGALYMLGAYVAYSASQAWGFVAGMFSAALVVALVGAVFERWVLRHLRVQGHVPELLATFGLSYVLVELVQLIWGRGTLDYTLPVWLQGAVGSLGGVDFPRARAFMMLLSLGMMGLLWGLWRRTRVGLVIQAALHQPQMVQALGHNLPLWQTAVFALGCALAGLAGALGGAVWVTEPGMAWSMGALMFVVVVVGGLGSLGGALWASLLIGCLQTFAVAASWHWAPVLPYALLVMVMVLRPGSGLGWQR